MIAFKVLISQRLNEGLTLRQIWLELHGAGLVSVTLKNFYVHANRLINPDNCRSAGRDLAVRKNPPAPVTIPVQRERAVTPAAQVEVGPTAQFVHNNRPSGDTDW